MVAVRMCCNIKLQIIGGDTEGVQVGEYLIVVAGRRCDAAAQRITRIRSVRVIPVLAGVYHAENFLAIIVYTFQNDGIGAAVECQNVNFCCSISRMCVFRVRKRKAAARDAAPMENMDLRVCREKGISMAPFVTYIIKTKSKTAGWKISAQHHNYTKFQGKVNVY